MCIKERAERMKNTAIQEKAIEMGVDMWNAHEEGCKRTKLSQWERKVGVFVHFVPAEWNSDLELRTSFGL